MPVKKKPALLSTHNPKVAKNATVGVLGAVLHLAPAREAGYNTCAMSTPGCRASCLHTAGNPAYMHGKQTARVRRTKQFFEQRDAFMMQLLDEITRHVKKAKKLGMHASVRLNGTSDIRWEIYPVTVNGVTYPNIMAALPNVQFYDYTKIPNRKNVPDNYHLTYSRSELSTPADIERQMANKVNVAVVFDKLPATYLGYPVFAGDDSDYRPHDPKGHIIGLTPKGKAKKETSGFVVRT